MNSTIRRYPRTLQQAFGPSNTPDCDLVQSLILNPTHRIKNHYKLDAFKALVVISTVLVLTAAILVVFI